MDSKKLKNLANWNGIVGLGGGILTLFSGVLLLGASTNGRMLAFNLIVLISFLVKVAILVLGIIGLVKFNKYPVISKSPSVLMIIGGSIAIIPLLGWIGGIISIVGGSLYLGALKNFHSDL